MTAAVYLTHILSECGQNGLRCHLAGLNGNVPLSSLTPVPHTSGTNASTTLGCIQGGDLQPSLGLYLNIRIHFERQDLHNMLKGMKNKLLCFNFETFP